MQPTLYVFLALNLCLGTVCLALMWRLFKGSAAQAQQLEARCVGGVLSGLQQMQQAASAEARQGREEMAASLLSFGQLVPTQMGQVAAAQGVLLENLRQVVEQKLTALQADNSSKLEQMRLTVDEKLHATLEHRLGDSFKLVGERLDLVNRGLGEMQVLAQGVGDLKKVLTNVKTRGTWGEVQLGNLLSQIFTVQQYACDVAVTPQSSDRVEYAIRLPGQTDAAETPVWLPIDAKFPQEDYQRLVDAAERGQAEQVILSGNALEQRIVSEAKKIREKYIHPPHTTDFAILFLPTEGLFAEVLRRPGLCDNLLLKQRVVLAGPTT
jgi:DNA recombination protein RmuC